MVSAVPGLPEVRPGDDLAALAGAALAAASLRPRAGDVLVFAQKVVSKAEGRFVDLATVTPSPWATALAREIDKDPRLVEVVLGESAAVVRHRPGVLIVEHRCGCVMANAGVDHSNVPAAAGAEPVLLLPRDPDASARALRDALAARFDADLAVIVADSVGRAWRLGTVGLALGAAGIPALEDLRGLPDREGRALEVSQVALADQIAAAAALVIGEAHEGTPLALVRGVAWHGAPCPAAALVRPREIDLFR